MVDVRTDDPLPIRMTLPTRTHVISLINISQSIDAGPLVGYPTRRQNRLRITQALNIARKMAGEIPVLLLPPVEKEISVAQGIYSDTRDPDDLYTRLPPIRCIAHFESEATSDGKSTVADGDFSELFIVWWQSTWAMPIAGETTAAIADLDWQLHARNAEI